MNVMLMSFSTIAAGSLDCYFPFTFRYPFTALGLNHFFYKAVYKVGIEMNLEMDQYKKNLTNIQ